MRRLRLWAEQVLSEEAEARAQARALLLPNERQRAIAMALTRLRTAGAPAERRRAARVLDLVEQASAQPDTATRWADGSGRWDKPFADRVADAPEPLGMQLLRRLVGGYASSTHTGA